MSETPGLAGVLCLVDDTREHQEQTDDFPCSRCKRQAAAVAVWLRESPEAREAVAEVIGNSSLLDRVRTALADLAAPSRETGRADGGGS